MTSIKPAMFSTDIGKGSDLIATLDSAKVKVSVALWAFLPEYGDWRLILSARQFDLRGIGDAYRLVYDSVARAGFDAANTPPITIMPMRDPFIRQLRRIAGKTKNVEGMRLGAQVIGDRFLEEAYVYRIG